MTKKMSMLVAIVISLLSIMIIAVWTSSSENNNPIPINEISIIDYDYLNDDEDKIKNIKEIVNETNPYYAIKYLIGPKDANSDHLKTYTDNDKVSVMIDVLNNEVNVFFDILTGINSVRVTIIDQKTNKFDSIILLFKISGEIIVPDF